MTTYTLSHLSDDTLLRDLATLVARDRATTAELLAHIAEVDGRKLYLPAGYPSMHAYCVGALHLSEESAFKRIRAARTARDFPAIFDAVSDGRLNLNAVVLLTPYLSRENSDDLLAAASHLTRCAIEHLLAERFPRSETLPMIEVVPASTVQGITERPLTTQLAARPVGQSGSGRKQTRVAPIAADRFTLQVTIGRDTHDKLRHAQALLGHRVPNGDFAEVLDRVLALAIQQLERQKFAATDRPRRANESNNPRTIPAHVQRAVWQRDEGQCTFVSSEGRRCTARDKLEFDHIDPVARGGPSTVNGIRLLCRAHNQYAAERAFGAEFMEHKRREARRAQEDRRALRAAEDAAKARAKERAEEVVPWLQALGIHAKHAREAAEGCESIPDAPIEERVRVALSYFGPRTPSRGGAAMAPAAT